METDSTTNPANVTPLEWAICSTQSNPRTRTLLREAVEHFDEQEKRVRCKKEEELFFDPTNSSSFLFLFQSWQVFRKYLKQNNLEQHEKVFSDRGLTISSLRKINDVDLRKMNISPVTLSFSS